MKQLYFLLVLCCTPFLNHAQLAILSGTVVDENQLPLNNISIFIPKLDNTQFSDINGNFSFSDIPFDTYYLIVNKQDTLHIIVDKNHTSLNTISINKVSVNNPNTEIIQNLALEEIPNIDPEAGDQNISNVYLYTQNPYLNTISYSLNTLKFKVRGYTSKQLQVFIKGLDMNDIESGSANFNKWSGLTDIFKNQEVTNGLGRSNHGFGAINGNVSFLNNKTFKKEQTRITYAHANRNFSNMVMLTHQSDINLKGWSYDLSASKRWADEGYVEGTFLDAYSYYGNISKRFHPKHTIQLSTFGSTSQNGNASAATQEAYDLYGSHYYNANWGYQNGNKRNTKVNQSFLPTTILNYEFNNQNKWIWNTALSFTSGYIANSSIDWYHAADPRPDYYKRMPSNYLYEGTRPDSLAWHELSEFIKANPSEYLQVNWAQYYDANRLNQMSINNETGNRSVYVLSQDRRDIKQLNFASDFKYTSKRLKINGGIQGALQKVVYYKQLLDLLGGDYFVNINQFTERTFVGNPDYSQNDLLHPNGIIKENDKYGYHYEGIFNRFYGWTQLQYVLPKISFFVSGKLGNEGYYRNGRYKNGLFPSESLGKSKSINLLTYASKAGFSYLISKTQQLHINGGIFSNAPTFDNTFFAPRFRNQTIDAIQNEITTSIEGVYTLNTKKIMMQLSGYSTNTNHQTQIKRFYHEDYKTFVNFVLQNIQIQNWGVELGLKYQMTPKFSMNLATTYMQVFYLNRPDVSIYLDNDTASKVTKSTAFIKNYHLSTGPQSASTFNIQYQQKVGFASLHFNYLDRNYVDINPARRTSEAIIYIDEQSSQFENIIKQEMLPAIFTMDLRAGASLKINKIFKEADYKQVLNVQIGINNLLNNKDQILAGYEQLRFDFTTKNPNRFPTKYLYGLGINYMVSISYKF